MHVQLLARLAVLSVATVIPAKRVMLRSSIGHAPLVAVVTSGLDVTRLLD